MNFFGGIGFGQPWMLWGLVACSVPILLNLLHRHRFQSIPWAAMKFLSAALDKNKKKLKFENLLLLILRMLIIFFAVLALSQPYRTSSHPFVSALSNRSNVIIIIDNSYSMGTKWGDQSYFEQAREQARKIIKERKVGDGVGLMVINRDFSIVSEPRVMDKERKTRQLLLDLIDGIELSDYSSDYSRLFPGLLNMVEKFKENPALEKTEYVKKAYFLTDNQKWGWRNLHIKDYAPALQKEQIVFVLHNLAKHDSNLTVTHLSIRGKGARVNLPFRFSLRIKNFGLEDVDKAFVTLQVAREQRGSTPLRWNRTTVPFSIGPRQEKIISLPRMILKKKGFYRGWVRIKRGEIKGQDGLERDSERFFVFSLQDSIRVLLIDGEPGEPSETDFLKLALNPHFLEKEKIPSLFQPVIQRGLPLKGLDKYQAVVLANYGSLSATQGNQLLQYVKKGGGLVIFLGENFSQKKTYVDGTTGARKEIFPIIEKYNSRLYHKGDRGLLPAKLSFVYRKIYANLNPTHYEHPLFRFFVNYKDRITSPRFQKYLALSPAPKAVVLARFSDGDNTPAVVEKKVGLGRVLLLNFSADRDWSNFPITQSYLIFVRKALGYVARSEGEVHNYRLGEDVSFPLHKNFELNLISPQKEALSNPTTESKQRLHLKPEVLDRAGVYQVEWKVGNHLGKKDYFALNLDSREGDLESLTREQTEKKLKGLILFYQAGRGDLESSAMQEKVLPSNQLWKPFLILALLCLLLEMWLAYWFGSKRR